MNTLAKALLLTLIVSTPVAIFTSEVQGKLFIGKPQVIAKISSNLLVTANHTVTPRRRRIRRKRHQSDTRCLYRQQCRDFSQKNSNRQRNNLKGL